MSGQGQQPVKSYADLRVWQLGMDLANSVYDLTERFPQREWYGLASQLRRAAVSVSSNIAEGHTRESTKEFAQHISITRASLAEVETQLKITAHRGFAAGGEVDKVLYLCGHLGRQLTGLRNALQRFHRPSL